MTKHVRSPHVVAVVAALCGLWLATDLGSTTAHAAPVAQTPVQPPASKGGGPVLPPVTQCTRILTRKSVPEVAINRAVEDPTRVYGWDQPLNPNRAEHPLHNPRKRNLTLLDAGKPYSELGNPLVFKAGCS